MAGSPYRPDLRQSRSRENKTSHGSLVWTSAPAASESTRRSRFKISTGIEPWVSWEMHEAEISAHAAGECGSGSEDSGVPCDDR
jgi:hypothetical protein